MQKCGRGFLYPCLKFKRLRMIIFFDWDHDGTSDHVGIVEKYEGGRVYTIEGNSSDQVRQRNYTVDYGAIMGYGRSW